MNGTFSLDNESELTPKIADVEQVYINRLEEGNQSDNSPLINTDINQSHLYGKITKTEFINYIILHDIELQWCNENVTLS